ncbi:AAA family ATPase [Deferribacter autotrophicus]
MFQETRALNSFLKYLDNFEEIFIATTNRINLLDTLLILRLNLKV